MLTALHLPKLQKEKNERAVRTQPKRNFYNSLFKENQYVKNPHLRNIFTILTINLFYFFFNLFEKD